MNFQFSISNFQLASLDQVTKKVVKVVEATPSMASPVVNSAVTTKIATPAASLAETFSSLPFYIFNLFFFSFIFLLWFLLVRWVGRDAQSRGCSPDRKKIFQVVVLIFNLPGLLIYLLLRPYQTLTEIRRAEMEDEILKLELEKLRRESQLK